MLMALKDALIAAGGTARRCSYYNGVGYTLTDDTDSWGADTSRVRSAPSASNRSWIVIRMPAAMGATCDVLLDYSPWDVSVAGAFYGRIAIGGYAQDGTASSGPTGTNVINPIPYAADDNGRQIVNAIGQRYWNSSYATDGSCFRFWSFHGGKCVMFFAMQTLKNPAPEIAAGSDLFVCWVSCASASSVPADRTTYSTLYTGNSSTLGFIAGSGAITYRLSGETSAGSATPATNHYTANGNPQDGDAWPLLPIGVWSMTNTAYAYGRMGELYDIWWAPSSLITGSTFPGDGSKTFIQLGSIVVPWNPGVVPSIT